MLRRLKPSLNETCNTRQRDNQKRDAPNNMVNLTHAPMPELNWPEMTMDLPTTRRVDLSSFNEGDKVEFMLKKGRDNRFRITEMKSAK